MSKPVLLAAELEQYIVQLALDSFGWSRNGGSFTRANCYGLKGWTRKDAEALDLLYNCCLVCRDWYISLRPVLYVSIRIWGPEWQKLQRSLSSNPDLGNLVRHAAISAHADRRSAVAFNLVDLFHSQRVKLSNLWSLNIEEGLSVRSLPYLPPELGEVRLAPLNLTHLVYTNGTAFSLLRLLAHLPNLDSLHVGSTVYDPLTGSLEQSRTTRAVCKLRHIVFQSVYHFDATLGEHLFASSVDTIESVTFARFGALLPSLIDFFLRAKRLCLTIKLNPFNVPEPAQMYQLDSVLERFEHLEQVTLAVPLDWTRTWPDDKHLDYAKAFSRINFVFYKGRIDFLSPRVPCR